MYHHEYWAAFVGSTHISVFVIVVSVASFFLLTSTVAAPRASERAILPPEIAWKGQSQQLIVPDRHPWVTPAEKSRFKFSPNYAETVEWLKRLVAASRELRLVSLGKSPEGRDIWMVIASKDRAFTPHALKATRKPLLLAQAGIHAGEIDGKDAGLMLLRDVAAGNGKPPRKATLLDQVNFLFVPIFNVDGHERSSSFGRINQRGPEITGWRTTSRNLNLNRDYTKLDAPEMRALVKAIVEYDPDLYLDLHVTDGEDYQYDITFGHNGPPGWSPALSTWLETELMPSFNQDLKAMGHTPGPLVFGLSGDLSKGILNYTSGPRLSTGYGDARHLPTVLVENHALKSYERRVLGTYVLLEGALKTLARSGNKLREAIEKDRALRREKVAIGWKVNEGAPQKIEFLGIESKLLPSEISGGLKRVWTGTPVTLQVPHVHMNTPSLEVARPKAYWIPPAWDDVIERLQAHGIQMERIKAPRTVEVEMYRLEEPKLASEAFEGHVAVTAKPHLEQRREQFLPGSVRISTDQPLGTLAVLLLEPVSPDSFFQWGFFHEILQQTEYADDYIMEPMAERMLAEDPRLAEQFKKKLQEDESFRGNPKARLHWFYRQTPFFDERWRLYPVAREN